MSTTMKNRHLHVAKRPRNDRFDSEEEYEHALGILKRLDRLQESNKACDLIIKVDGKEIRVHRSVLMAGSDYFDAMFSHDTAEEKSGIVEMKDVTLPAMKKLVNFIYTGRISITENGCEDLLLAARMIQLSVVCDKVVSFLKRLLNLKSFFKIREIAIRFDLENLQKFCDDFALKNLGALAQKEEFNFMEMEFIGFLVACATLDEDTRIAVILQWIKSDVEARRQHLLQLSSLMNLGRISSACQKHISENEELCYKSWEFMKMLCLHGIGKDVEGKPPVIFPLSDSPNAVLLFDKTFRVLQAYRPSTGSFAKMQQLPEEMMSTSYTATVLKEHLYVLMGNKKIFKIDFRKKDSTWKQMKDMLDVHGNYLRSTSHDVFIYVVGNESFERYSETNNEWERLNTSEVCALESELVKCDCHIYSIGGVGKKIGEALKDVNRFTPSTLTWASVKPMQIARRTPSAAVHGKKIFVAGGLGGEALSSVEYLDTENENWTNLTSMLVTHDVFRLCCIDNKLIAVGNETDLQCSESYDFDNYTWKIIEGLPKIVVKAQAAVAVMLHGYPCRMSSQSKGEKQ